MMANEGIPFSTFQGWPLYHIDGGSIVLDEIHIDRGEVDQGMTQVSGQGHGLQKDLRHDNGRTKVDKDPPL
jgi:hypothetical protein